MIPNTVGRWLLVTLALLGLGLAVPVVSAHDGDPVGVDETVDAEPPVVGQADRAAWMDAHMSTDTLAPRGWHMRPPVEEMAQHMGIDDRRNVGDDYRDITADRRGNADDWRGIADDRYDDRTRSHSGGC